MAIFWDLSWFFQLLPTIVDNLANFISSLTPSLDGIVNTGQGILSGLSAVAGAIWDAITKAFSTLGEWISKAFEWIKKGLEVSFAILGQWLSNAYQWLAGGIQWIAGGLWDFGCWLYNGFKLIWSWISNMARGIWEAISNFFWGISKSIASWWENITRTVNSWFTNLVVGVRNKMIQTIMADVSIYFGWKSMERLIQASSSKDALFSILGLIGSPLVAYLFGSIINGIIPTPSTSSIELIPTIPMFEFTPPSLTVETPTEPTPPSAPPSPPAYGFYPVLETSLSVASPTYACRWDVGKQQTLSLDAPTYTIEVSG